MKKIICFMMYTIFLIFSYQIVICQDLDTTTFLVNSVVEFSTKDHPKAKGIHITIKYPGLWEKQEGSRPNIVQMFSKGFTNANSIDYIVTCHIIIKDIPAEISSLSEKDLAEAFFSAEASTQPEGMTLLDHVQTKYDGQPGSLSSVVQVQNRVGLQMTGYSLNHRFVYSKKYIGIECSIGGLSANAEEIQKIYQEYIPVFKQIGISIVLQDKWK